MLITALRDRVARDGARPLLTYYDASDDSRVELSTATFSNWVDKTANLIADLGHDDGEPVDLPLLRSHPGHWVTLVWLAAAWQRGCPVNSTVTGAEFLVVGPGDERRADTTVACSLHPLGRGFQGQVEGAIDYVEVFAQPDMHDRSSLGDVMLMDGREAPAPVDVRDDRRLLPDPVPGWGTVVDALVAPVLGSGSTVVAVGFDPDALVAVAATEHASG